MSVVSPVHIEAVGLSNIRFFAPREGWREFPWPAFDDVANAMAVGRNRRRTFRNELLSGPWAHAARTVETPDGPVLVCQHYAVQGLIDAMAQVGRCDPDFYWKYAKAGTEALCSITVGFSKDELLDYLKCAVAAGGANG